MVQVFALVSNDGTEWLSSKDLNEEAALLFRYFCGSDLECIGASDSEHMTSDIRHESTYVVEKSIAASSTEQAQPPLLETRETNGQVAVADFIMSDQSDNVVGATDERLARIRRGVLQLQNVIKNKDQSELLLQHIEGSTLLNINDIGGQPAFLEMLPALSNGPVMYLVFADLSKELNKPYKIPFSRDDTTITPYDAMHTVESTVSQILSSIASIHRISQEPVPFKLDRSTAFGQQFECVQWQH